MSQRDDDNLARADAVDDLVRKTGDEQPTGLLIGGHGVSGLGIQCQPVNRPCDLTQEVVTETRAL